MSATQIDFYRILGVIDSAEPAVIKAAYKALMMIYHPDRYDGNKDDAIKKSKKINEAYAVLIDPAKRKKYDEERSTRKNQYEPEPESEQEDKGFKDARNDVLEDDWDIAIEHVIGLDDWYKSLNVLSPDLAFTFKLEILESKRFDQAKVIAEDFETLFIEKFFGSNRDIKDFSRWLLRHGKRDIAKELNRIVVVLGSSLNGHDVIQTIVKKYKLDDYKSFNDKPFNPMAACNVQHSGTGFCRVICFMAYFFAVELKPGRACCLCPTLICAKCRVTKRCRPTLAVTLGSQAPASRDWKLELPKPNSQSCKGIAGAYNRSTVLR